jgi:hypothetical protein
MKPTTTALSIQTATIQPKPTKTEILDAMLIRAKAKHEAENARREAKRETLHKKIEALAIKLAKGKTPHVSFYPSSKAERCHCDVRVNNVQSTDLTELLLEYDQNSGSYWDERETRAAIRRELSGIKKPTPTRLLENPEMVKSIDAMLEQWGI